jgi:hypothetical protein
MTSPVLLAPAPSGGDSPGRRSGAGFGATANPKPYATKNPRKKPEARNRGPSLWRPAARAGALPVPGSRRGRQAACTCGEAPDLAGRRCDRCCVDLRLLRSAGGCAVARRLALASLGHPGPCVRVALRSSPHFPSVGLTPYPLSKPALWTRRACRRFQGAWRRDVSVSRTVGVRSSATAGDACPRRAWRSRTAATRLARHPTSRRFHAERAELPRSRRWSELGTASDSASAEEPRTPLRPKALTAAEAAVYLGRAFGRARLLGCGASGDSVITAGSFAFPASLASRKVRPVYTRERVTRQARSRRHILRRANR